jgi:hypothetical protein
MKTDPRETPEYHVLVIPNSEAKPQSEFTAGWHAGWKAGAAAGVAQRIKGLLRANDAVPGYLRKQIAKLCDEAIYGEKKHQPKPDPASEMEPRHAWD